MFHESSVYLMFIHFRNKIKCGTFPILNWLYFIFLDMANTKGIVISSENIKKNDKTNASGRYWPIWGEVSMLYESVKLIRKIVSFKKQLKEWDYYSM